MRLFQLLDVRKISSWNVEFLSGYFELDVLSDMISNTKSQQSKSENRKLIQETFDIKKEDNKERLRNVYISK